MKTSSVKHLDNDDIVVVRKSFIDVCGDKDAGILLSYFVYWNDIKIAMNMKNKKLNEVAEIHGDKGMNDVSMYQYHTSDEIAKQTLGILSRRGITEGRKKLRELGFISEHKNPNPQYKFDNTRYFLVHANIINDALTSLNHSYTHSGETVVPVRLNGPTELETIRAETTTETTTETNSFVTTEVDDETSKSNSEKEISKSVSEATSVAEYLATKLEESIETYKRPSKSRLKAWSRDIDRAIRLDGRTGVALKQVIRWVHDKEGSFWIPNIKSGKKLREQFDTLWFQMKSSKNNVPVKSRALSDFGLGNVFFEFMDTKNNKKIRVCLFGDYGMLYDYNRNKYIDKSQSDKVWKYIEDNYEHILNNFNGEKKDD